MGFSFEACLQNGAVSTFSHAREKAIQLFAMYRTCSRIFDVQEAPSHELRQGFFEGERAVTAGNRDLLMEVLQRVLADVLTCTVPDHQQFGRRDPAASRLRQQDLSHD